jgi:hypothetical protein
MESNEPWLEALSAGFDMFLTLKFLSISEVFSPLWFLSDYQPFSEVFSDWEFSQLSSPLWILFD